jgi:glycosyltransferase involved in cell wall biosynthesis
MNQPKLLIVAHANLGTSLSGGDRIFLNLIRYWQKHFEIRLFACPETDTMVKKFKLHPKTYLTLSSKSTVKSLNTLSLSWHHFSRFVSGIIYCLKHKYLFKTAAYIYTSSDFYGDFVFGYLAKLINPKIVWICGYYLLAPNPFDHQSPYIQNHHFIRGLVYYLAQLPSKSITKSLADFVMVTSKPDIAVFQNHRLNSNKIIIVQGGVYIPSSKVLKKLKSPLDRKYDAFYLGRLHSQKGVLEMVDIWRKVVDKVPKAKLSIIGDGELMDKLVAKVKDQNLTKNINIVGFAIGKKKFDLIKESKIVLHPATYDSGGMAAAEAMAWGLPGVSFDLEALKTYYPQGMIKTPCFDQKLFAQNIINLLTDSALYHRYSLAARKLILSQWDWQNRLENIYKIVIN